MAQLPIKTFPDPVLRQRARRIKEIDPKLQKLIDDMIETLHSCAGVGLAAPQVGESVRLVIIEIPGEEVLTLINPEVIRRKGEFFATEGCLSIPGYRAEVKHSEMVKVKAIDREGNEIRIKGEDLLAQAMEHEIDHLNGVLFIDHLESLDELEKIPPDEPATAEEAKQDKSATATSRKTRP
jgi:peptide deformylase